MNPEHVIESGAVLLKSVLETLAYFNVFRHPLTGQEIVEFSPIRGCTRSAVENALHDLLAGGLVFENRGYFSLIADGSLLDERISANQRAVKRMPAAWFYSSLIARFPFVRAVMISGSLSKGVMDAKDDIDFFIITEPGRLWITRVMLTLFKKLVLLNSHRNFCLNYFIDTDHLAIPDRNVFTAAEIGLILPMYNRKLYNRFLLENSWFRSYFPNIRTVDTVRNNPSGFPHKLFEWLLSGKPGDRLDDLCLKYTLRFLERKYRHLQPEKFRVNMESSKSVSKHHPQNQQFLVLRQYNESIRILDERMKAIGANTGKPYEYGKSA
ncbi:MAG: hypothetical protein WC699_13455 [Bacteroidales bacterium]|jgi:hypothetical protein